MKLKLLSLLLAASAMTAACGDDGDNIGPDATTARVRVVHASPDAPNVDVLVDGAVTLSDLEGLDVHGNAVTVRLAALGTRT